MKLTFLGATHEVTGSCSLIEAAGKNLLVDYGMEQGKDYFENQPLPILPADIDYVFLTHAHIDHSGLMPLLYKNGFRGEVHTSFATKNLCGIMLLDSAHIQESDAEYKNRKNKRKGKKLVEPLYDTSHANGVLEKFVGHAYDKKIPIAEGIEVRFTDAGHLLGSSSVELWLTERGETRKIVFSGDVGNINQPLLRDPQHIDTADYAVIESTYGDREHNPPPDYAAALAEVLQRTLDRGGNMVIPSFAVGRTQEMLYFFRQIKEQGLIKGHDNFPVYVDSPLAIKATRVFVDNADSCYDEEARRLLNAGINPIAFPGLVTAETAEESIALNTDPVPKVIISASGMCDAGRVRHHLKHNLWRPESTILFVGYQSVGTVGRQLCDGASEVKLFGEEIAVQAEICQLPGISGHGDVNELIRWVRDISPSPKMVFVNHGEADVCDAFASRLTKEYGLSTYAPYSGTVYDLIENRVAQEAEPVYLKKTSKESQQQTKQSGKQVRSVYEKLLIALERLTKLIHAGEGRTNRDIEKLTRDINDLCNEWEK